MIRNKRIYHNLQLPELPNLLGKEYTAMATKVNTAAEILPALSVLKLRRPMARPPRTTVN